MRSPYVIPAAIIIGGAIVAAAVYVSAPKAPRSTVTLVRPISAADHIFGSPAAPVKIVEYSDFDCTFCRSFDTTLRQVVANEGANGSVAWVYREFPIVEIHPNALPLARAAECAGMAGGNEAFWKFADLLFANQPVDPSQVGAIASKTDLTGVSFAACYANASTTVDARIMADRQNALDMGADGTPYSLILVAGKSPVVVNGAYSYDAVKQLVDQALTK